MEEVKAQYHLLNNLLNCNLLYNWLRKTSAQGIII